MENNLIFSSKWVQAIALDDPPFSSSVGAFFAKKATKWRNGGASQWSQAIFCFHKISFYRIVQPNQRLSAMTQAMAIGQKGTQRENDYFHFMIILSNLITILTSHGTLKSHSTIDATPETVVRGTACDTQQPSPCRIAFEMSSNATRLPLIKTK